MCSPSSIHSWARCPSSRGPEEEEEEEEEKEEEKEEEEEEEEEEGGSACLAMKTQHSQK